METILIYVINTIIGVIIGWLVKRYRDAQAERDQIKRDNEILKQGFQALLRANMVADYNKYNELGYMPIYAKDSFESIYAAYHRMGANGVMQDIYTKIMAMPTEQQDD